MLHDLNSLLREEKNYESQTADLRVEQKYIDYCLEEKEELEGGIVGFSENGRRLGSDICNIRATALWDRNTKTTTNKQTNKRNKQMATQYRHLQHPCHCTLGS